MEFERGRISKIRARLYLRNHLLYNSISGPEGRRRTVRPGSGPPSHDAIAVPHLQPPPLRISYSTPIAHIFSSSSSPPTVMHPPPVPTFLQFCGRFDTPIPVITSLISRRYNRMHSEVKDYHVAHLATLQLSLLPPGTLGRSDPYIFHTSIFCTFESQRPLITPAGLGRQRRRGVHPHGHVRGRPRRDARRRARRWRRQPRRRRRQHHRHRCACGSG